MKQFRYITVFFTWVIIMLHAFVPHDHHRDDTGNTVIAHEIELRSFADFLDCLLHVDLGEEHLRHYAKQDQPVVDHNIDIISVNALLRSDPAPVRVFDLEKPTRIPRDEKRHPQRVLSPRVLRGPPASA